MTDHPVRIGIDFGGTKTELVALDGRNGKELYRKRILNEKGSYEVTLRSFEALVNEAESSIGQQATVGMGMPGCISDDTGCVKNSNAVWMNGKPLKKDLERILNREVRIENDANCFAVSEAVDGAGIGKHVVFGVIIGTGCGGGVAVHGKPVKGVNGIGGEWGHNPLPYPRVYTPEFLPNIFSTDVIQLQKDIISNTTDKSWNEYPGDLCYCGKTSCLETWISGTGFKRDYVRVTGEDLSTHDIIAAARSGEAKAVAALDRYCDRLARALAVVVNIIDPDVIVLGGGMSNVATLYEEVPKLWSRYIFTDVIHTQLKSPLHGDSSGVRGAAWLWND